MKEERKTFGLTNFGVLSVIVGFLGLNGLLSLTLLLGAHYLLFTLGFWHVCAGIMFGLMTKNNSMDWVKEEH